MKRTRLRRRNAARIDARRKTQFGVQADLCRQLRCCECFARAPSDPEHVRTRGAGGKDRDTVPLCRTCHQLRHQHGHGGPFLEGRAATPVRVWDYVREVDPLVSSASRALTECARAFFDHVARGLDAVIKLTNKGGL